LLSLLERAPPPCTCKDAPEVKLCICRRQSVEVSTRPNHEDDDVMGTSYRNCGPLVGGGHIHVHGPVTNVAANFLFLGNSKHSMHIPNENNVVL
jgi:hypothetical protein